MDTVVVHLLVAVLLICLGVLLGASWTIQVLQARLRRQAKERRRLNAERHRLNAEWASLRAARRHRQ